MDVLNLSYSCPLLPQTKLLLISSIPQWGYLLGRGTGSVPSGQDSTRAVIWHILERLTTIVVSINGKVSSGGVLREHLIGDLKKRTQVVHSHGSIVLNS